MRRTYRILSVAAAYRSRLGRVRKSRDNTQLSRGCGVLFFGVFLLGGILAGLGLFWNLVRPIWRANFSYVQTQCVILDKRIAVNNDGDGTTYRPELNIKYSVGGSEFQVWTYDAAHVWSSGQKRKQDIIDQFDVGREYACWYDPDEPNKAVLVRGWSWSLLFLLIPLIFVAVGGGGIYAMLRFGKVQRRRLAVDPHDPAMLSSAGAEIEQLPNIPELDLSDRPGTLLKYRLPDDITPGCALIALLGVNIFWNGITWLFVTLAILGEFEGIPRWAMALFLTPFVLIGLLLVFALFRQLLVTTGVGATTAEVSDHPLRAGGTYQISVSQSGNLQVNDFRVLLVCEEEVKYQQGTSTRTESNRVYQLELFRNEAFEILKGLPFEAKFEVRVPPTAMHSFEANHNKIKWKLVVKGDIAGWPDFDRAFKLIVLPPKVA